MIQRAAPVVKDSISIRLVEEALHGFVERGEPVDELLREIGLEPALLADPAARVEVRDYSRLWLHLEQGPIDPLLLKCDLGLEQVLLRIGQLLLEIGDLILVELA